jgi:hypothetical protein
MTTIVVTFLADARIGFGLGMEPSTIIGEAFTHTTKVVFFLRHRVSDEALESEDALEQRPAASKGQPTIGGTRLTECRCAPHARLGSGESRCATRADPVPVCDTVPRFSFLPAHDTNRSAQAICLDPRVPPG